MRKEGNKRVDVIAWTKIYLSILRHGTWADMWSLLCCVARSDEDMIESKV